MRSARRRASRSAAATIAAWAVFAVCGGVTADGAAGLTTPVTGSWKGVSLRALGERLAGATGVAIVIDRRIDGATPLSLDAEGMPAVELLRLAASEARCGLALVRSGARFVPSHLVAMIEAGDREAARAEAEAPVGLRRKLSRGQALAWEAGSRPRNLVEQLADSTGIRLEGVDRLPHDHLPEGRSPTLPVGEQFAILLGHYDLTFTPSGAESIRIIPTPAEPSDGGVVRRGDADERRSGTGNGSLPRRGSPGRPPARGPRPADAMPIDAFSLEAAAPLQDLLTALASRFQLKLRIDEASLRAKAVDPREIVRVRLVDTPRDGVLDAVLGPLGLEWTIDDGLLTVR